MQKNCSKVTKIKKIISKIYNENFVEKLRGLNIDAQRISEGEVNDTRI